MPIAELERIFNSGSRRLEAVECVAGSGWNVFSTLSSVSQTILERFFSANQSPGR